MLTHETEPRCAGGFAELSKILGDEVDQAAW
jgi:hypothetical protein